MTYITPDAYLSASHVESVWEHLERHYNKLLKKVSKNEQIVVTAYLFGGTKINVGSFGYAGPNLMSVNGDIHGQEIKAFIHQSCLQVVFSVVAKDVEEPRRTMGFLRPDQSPETLHLH